MLCKSTGIDTLFIVHMEADQALMYFEVNQNLFHRTSQIGAMVAKLDQIPIQDYAYLF